MSENIWCLDVPKIGIYKIQSRIHSDRFYIGSSVNIKKRLSEHKRKLFLNEHDSPKLQDHFNKYSWQDLDYSIVEECEKAQLVEREQYYIDTLKPWFNICQIAGNCLGKKHSEETKRKLKIARNRRAAVSGWHHSEETKKKWSEMRKGRKLSKETIEKIVSKTKGKKRTEECKKRISESLKGAKHYAYRKPARNRGTKHTEESKRKMSIAHKNMSEETKRKMSESAKGIKRGPHSLETKLKISNNHKGKHFSTRTEFKVGHKNYRTQINYGETG